MEESQLLVFVGTAVVVVAVGGVLFYWFERRKLAQMSPEERAEYLAEKERQRREEAKREREEQETEQYGPINPAMVCPHCQVAGKVRTQQVRQKKGISGGKATAAVLTGGWSILATGLSRKESATQAHCGHCGSTWAF